MSFYTDNDKGRLYNFGCSTLMQDLTRAFLRKGVCTIHSHLLESIRSRSV